MIAAADTLEFTPGGRKIINEDHPGPLSKRNDNIPSEFLLLHRMQNVSLNKEEHINENWTIREVHKHTNTADDLVFLNPVIVNSEDELYFKGNTAVWSQGIQNNQKASSEICYTSENPIQYAFFCPKDFIDADYKKSERKSLKNEENDENVHGIAIIDSDSIKVYATSGENLISAIESPISNIWITKHSILIEKDASSSLIDGHSIQMPRIFSLSHPLDDMYPVLLKSNHQISYISDADYKVS